MTCSFIFFKMLGTSVIEECLRRRRIAQKTSPPIIQQTLHSILSSLVPLLPPDESIPEMFTSLNQKTSILLPSSYKIAFQSVWLAHLRHPFEPAQLKQLLLIVHKRIIPYMNKPQLLMDWLTDSYNTGCSFTNKADCRRKHVSFGLEWIMGVDAKV